MDNRLAVGDTNIQGKKFYVRAHVYERTPSGYIITDKGTFHPDGQLIGGTKFLVSVTEEIEAEIEKHNLYRELSFYLRSSLRDMNLEDLQIIHKIFKKYHSLARESYNEGNL